MSELLGGLQHIHPRDVGEATSARTEAEGAETAASREESEGVGKARRLRRELSRGEDGGEGLEVPKLSLTLTGDVGAGKSIFSVKPSVTETDAWERGLGISAGKGFMEGLTEQVRSFAARRSSSEEEKVEGGVDTSGSSSDDTTHVAWGFDIPDAVKDRPKTRRLGDPVRIELEPYKVDVLSLEDRRKMMEEMFGKYMRWNSGIEDGNEEAEEEEEEEK